MHWGFFTLKEGTARDSSQELVTPSPGKLRERGEQSVAKQGPAPVSQPVWSLQELPLRKELSLFIWDRWLLFEILRGCLQS